MALLAKYNATLQLIESASLTPIEHSIWRAFLNEAVDPEHAACYIWERIHDCPDFSTEQRLVTNFQSKPSASPLAPVSPLTIKSVIRRDLVSSQACALVETRENSHCLMLNKKPSGPNVSLQFDHVWVIPPSLFDESDMDPQGPLYPLLRGFLTPTKKSELQTILQTNKLESQLRNLFLLSPSVHLAFRNGKVQILPPTNTPDQWNDETETRIKTPTEVYPYGRLFLSYGSHWKSTMQIFIMESQDTN
ncbi:Aminoglycoside phosphotransferase [Penicillium vulpinum]|uniref:Aminoglycoside phosphotransferase n=1 Tax=Penicillium vulpinum TaxID=29845 RepID=UPI002548C898|nr:Aminoglycoside phosphotransferase [Penicillium vulpinum]KAJ5950608.1 Aminoglycoside phosphotransferase [Penicillium vulpinum]